MGHVHCARAKGTLRALATALRKQSEETLPKLLKKYTELVTDRSNREQADHEQFAMTTRAKGVPSLEQLLELNLPPV